MARKGKRNNEETLELARKFGRNLAKERRRAGLSQEAVGRRAQVHRTEIGMLEHAQRVPRIDTVIRLAGALELPSVAPLVIGIKFIPAEDAKAKFQIAQD